MASPVLTSIPYFDPPLAPPTWPEVLADALSTAQNEVATLSLLIRRGDLGRRLQLEAAERRVRMLSGQLTEARP